MGDEVQHLVVEQLKLLRGDLQEFRADTNKRLDQTNKRLDQTNKRLDQSNERLCTLQEESRQRFELIETALRDSTQQLVVLARGVHASIQGRQATREDITELDRRVSALEAGSSAT